VDAVGTSALFNAPFHLALAPDGGTLYVADWFNRRVRSIALETGVVETVVGSDVASSVDGIGTNASFTGAIRGLAITPNGHTLIVSDETGNCVRSIALVTRQMMTLAGTCGTGAGHVDGKAADARFNAPVGSAVSPDGSTLILADCNNHRVRSIAMASGATATLAGSGTAGSTDGTGTAARFNMPFSVAILPDGTTAFVGSYGDGTVRAINLATQMVTTLITVTQVVGIALTPDSTTVIAADYSNRRLYAVTLLTGVATPIADPLTFRPAGLAVSPDGSTIYVAGRDDHRIHSLAVPV